MARDSRPTSTETVRARLARELRDRILTGVWLPGARIDIDAVCREFGVSRTPVRESLLELSYYGLVQIAPRSSVTVIGSTPRLALDNFGVFAALSGKAAELAAHRIEPAALDELTRQARMFEDARSSEELIDANWRFHRCVNLAADSPPLLLLIRQAVRMIPSNFLSVLPVSECEPNEHEELLRMIARGRAARARTVAERHVQAAGDQFAAWLADRDSAHQGLVPGSAGRSD